MDEHIPPTSAALSEALDLSAEILKDIELDQLPLTNVAMKTERLARLLNDYDGEKIMHYEVGGYPSAPDGVTADVFRLARRAGRTFVKREAWATTLPQAQYADKEVADLDGIGGLESLIESGRIALSAAKDPDVSVSSANPAQTVFSPFGNSQERYNLRTQITNASRTLAKRRAFIHSYVAEHHYQLKFSGIADDIFARVRARVDKDIGRRVPDSVRRLTSAYENLKSDNPEDWSNAVHSCRRVLKDLADAIFPTTSETRERQHDGKHQQIRLGEGQYINRILAFVEDHSDSERFTEIVGSNLKFLGERLDAVSKATQKGTHTDIVRREEADRYVVHTYLIVGDIISLSED